MIRISWLGLALVLCVGSSAAQSAGPDSLDQPVSQTELPHSAPGSQHGSGLPFHASRLLGYASARGVSVQGAFLNDWSRRFHDSTDTAYGFGRYSFDLSLAFDGGKLLGWNSATGYIRFKQHVQEFGTAYDAATQVISNIDAAPRSSLYELWLQKTFFSEKLRLKAGKIDANTEFDVLQSGGDFLNSSMGYSPTILGFPSYPEPKLGIAASLLSRRNYGLSLGVFRTAGLGTLSIAEPGRTWSLGNRELNGRVSLGYWRLDGPLSRFDGRHSANTQGMYSVLEQALWRRALPGEGHEQRLSAFLQFGHSAQEISFFTRHLGAGAVLQAPLHHRPADSLGLAATWVRLAPSPAESLARNSELVFETYYKLALTPHLAIVQDFQFLHHPGGLASNPDCPVITPRLVFTF